MLKQAHLDREWWSYACRFAGHMMREKVLGREGPHPLFGQLVGIWRSHDKAQATSLDDRGSVGYLLDIDVWQSGTYGLCNAPKRLDPTTGKGMPAGFYRAEEPPRIGSGQVQPAPPPKLPGSTPTTPAPAHPPRPPIEALPKPAQGGESSYAQASSASASSAGSTQQASATQGVSRNSTRRFDDFSGSTLRS